MTGTRVALLVLVGWTTAPCTAVADDGPARRPRLLEAPRIRQLADTLRSDPDERSRKAAAGELAAADPRVHPEVMPALLEALRSESAEVRAMAAETIGRFRTVFPLAGDALEQAAESDPSPAVRAAAKQSLWEYHLNGYKSGKGKTIVAAQTAEPPLAKPGGPRPAADPPPAVAVTRPTSPAAIPPGPRVAPVSGLTDPRAILTRPAAANTTGEPPLAKAPTPAAPAPKLTQEPPLLPRWPEPVVIGHSPKFTLDLPPVVTPPDGK